MKFNLNKGTVTLTSETHAEALKLFAIATEQKEVYQPSVRKVKKHKKHEFVKRCDVCGKGFKGNRSLGSHKAKAHGIRSAQAEKNHQYYLKWKMRKEAKPVTAADTFNQIWK